ncbi:BamA/TamA family outer membrane protein [bacterium]|nr:BamA/TamA family outer membrane protein [bacterium]
MIRHPAPGARSTIAPVRAAALALLVVLPASVAAQSADDDPAFRPPGEEVVLDPGPVSVNVGGTVLAPAWISGVSGFGFGVQTLGVFHLGEPGANLASTHRMLGLYTLAGRWRLESDTDLYWGGNTWHANLEPRYDGLRTGFYGVGNPPPLADAEEYEPNDLGMVAGLYRRLYRNLQVGLVYELAYHEVHESEAGGLIESDPDLIGQDGWISGVGLALAFDSRDRIFSPRHGVYATYTVTGFPDQLGGEYDFTEYELDLRTYLPLARRHVLALQAYTLISRGATPFWRLPSVGDLPHSRAYGQERFRDKTLGGLQVEWRWQWSSRFGLEVFAGGVTLDDDRRDLRLDEMRPSLGASLRVRRPMGDDAVPMRIGGAWGDDGWRLVFGVGDAF